MATGARPKDGSYLLWSKAERVGGKQSAWYDHTFYRVPVVTVKNGVVSPATSPIETGRIHTALTHQYAARAGRLFGSAVGGFCSCSSVADNGDGTVTVEQLYHIGD